MIMNEKQLGSLTRVELRDIWYDEAGAFTPWLATPENLQLLGQTLGLELEYEDQETRVGSFRADISARDTSDGSWVLIENQLERTYHSKMRRTSKMPYISWSWGSMER